MKCSRIKLLAAILLCFSTIFLSGCWDQKIFEEIGFILQLGLETDENGELIYSVTLPVVEEEIDNKIEILSSKVHLLREAREKLRNKSGKRVEGGKTQQIIFSKELAQQGVAEILDVFIRSPENPLLANILVVDGSPLEMFNLSLEFKDKTRLPFYITDLLEDARKRSLTPEIRISDFNILIFSETIDPVAAYLRYCEREVEVIGTALFNGAKMVGEIGVEESGLLHALMGEKINFEYITEDPDKSHTEGAKNGAAIFLKKVKRKVKINLEEDIPKIDIHLDFLGTVDELDTQHRLYEPEIVVQYEKQVASAIAEDCMKLLKYLQEVRADPIGFGEMVRAKHNAYYKSVEWDEIYPKITFNVEATLNIEYSGALT